MTLCEISLHIEFNFLLCFVHEIYTLPAEHKDLLYTS